MEDPSDPDLRLLLLEETLVEAGASWRGPCAGTEQIDAAGIATKHNPPTALPLLLGVCLQIWTAGRLRGRLPPRQWPSWCKPTGCKSLQHMWM